MILVAERKKTVSKHGRNIKKNWQPLFYFFLSLFLFIKFTSIYFFNHMLMRKCVARLGDLI